MTHLEARAAAERDYGPVHETGTQKVCPRCGRRGWTFRLDPRKVGVRFLTVWDLPSRGAFKDRPDMDSWGLEAMLAPWNGCGYCPRENPPDDRAPWRGRDVIKLPPVSSEDLDVLVAKGRRE